MFAITEGAPIAYSGPDGVIEGRWGHLIDTTYDGIRHQGQLQGGLGQLVDGIKGADNFSHNQGLEWVGWKSKDGDLHLEFSFKTLRNFTGALFHSNNLFSSGVEALQAMDVHYGIDIQQSIGPLRDALDEPKKREQAAANSLNRFGRQATNYQQRLSEMAPTVINNQAGNTVWSSKVLRIEYEPDKRLETARPVTVHLDHQLANKLKFVLKFASKWILISEVEFLSHPVELMSFASLSEQHSLPLMEALSTTKSYDEYVAILREHQLRRIAANAFFGISTTTASTTPNNNQVIQATPATSENQDLAISADEQPANEASSNNNQQQADLSAYQSIDVSSLDRQQQHSSPYENIFGHIKPGSNRDTNYLRDATASVPATSSSVFNLAYPPPGLFSSGPPIGIQQADSNNLATDPMKRQANGQFTGPVLLQQNNSLGFVTVISLVIVVAILLISLLIGISRYHLNRQHQPKLGFPGFPFNSTPSPSSSGSMQAQRKELGASPIKGLVSPLMSVFSSQNLTTNTMANGQHLTANVAQHPYQLEAYNTIFAPGHGVSTSTKSSDSNQSSTGISVRNTLGRLANFGNNSRNNQQQQQHSLHQHQLLVSVKDTSSSSSSSNGGLVNSSKLPFGYQTNGKDSAVSTQLIVGLNQANPLAHQQVYSSSTTSTSNNNSQQTYATQYTASSAGSSNCGPNGSRLHHNPVHNYATTADYNQYATPDLSGSQYASNGPLSMRTEILRSSCRGPANNQIMSNGNHFHNNSFTLSNRFNQQQFNHNNNNNNNINDLADMQHNYELIHHDSDNSSSYQQQQQQQAFHSRTLSKQMRYNLNQDQNLINGANGDLMAKKMIDLR